MASFKKIHEEEMPYVLRHIFREYPPGKIPSNTDIDREHSKLNYMLTPREHGTNTEEVMKYLHKIEENLYYVRRHDRVAGISWIITLPQDCPVQFAEAFFSTAQMFLEDSYRKEYVLASIVHLDEGFSASKYSGDDLDENFIGRPHLHSIVIPVAKDTNAKHNSVGVFEKICCKEVLTRSHLRAFHRRLADYMAAYDVPGTVLLNSNGNPARKGNLTVKYLKQRSMEAEQTRLRSSTRNSFLQEANKVHSKSAARWAMIDEVTNESAWDYYKEH